MILLYSALAVRPKESAIVLWYLKAGSRYDGSGSDAESFEQTTFRGPVLHVVSVDVRGEAGDTRVRRVQM